MFILSASGYFYLSFYHYQANEKLNIPEKIYWDSSLSDSSYSQIQEVLKGFEVVLNYTPKIWLGDNGKVSVLIFSLIKHYESQVYGNTYTFQSESQIPYDLAFEARLYLKGFKLNPGEKIILPIGHANQVNFFWSVKPIKSENEQGTLWLYINAVPKVDGDIVRGVLFAVPITIEVISLFGAPIFWWKLLSLSLGVLAISAAFDIPGVLVNKFLKR